MRRLALLPLTLFGAQAVAELASGTPLDLLWVCHVANLSLGLGLLAEQPLLIGAAALLLLGGFPWWGVEVFTAGTTPVSVASHVGGVGTAVWVLRRGLHPHSWWVAWVAVVVLQQICRWTPPHLNINLAHAIHPSSTAFFDSFAVYRTSALFGALLALAAGSALIRHRVGDPS